MFSKLALFTVASLVAFVAAIPTPGGGSGDGSINDSCNTDDMYCCKTTKTYSKDRDGGSPLLKLLDLGEEEGLLGFQCSPLFGGNCQQQPVCCTDNNFDGTLVIGCSPLNVNA